jgi:phenylacetate-coenzyme A ligase PaaK-like adenylate-forming protein
MIFRIELKEEVSQSERLKEEIEKSIREVTKLRPNVQLVLKGSIPDGVKKIEDHRSWE